MKKLSKAARKLLDVLVGEIHSGRIVAGVPATFLGYGETLGLLKLPETALEGGTNGQVLQRNGLDELGYWLRDHPENPPALTGLIVSKAASDFQGESRPPEVPGAGFFKLYDKKKDDWHWWLEEVEKSIAFDWDQFLGQTQSDEEGTPVRLMGLLERSIIEKAGNNNGFENKPESGPELVRLSSSRHKAEVRVTPSLAGENAWHVLFPKGPPMGELMRSFPDLERHNTGIHVSGESSLGKLFRRAAELAQSLPNQAADEYTEAVAEIEANPPSTTEVLAEVKQRRGQEIYRKALMDYWGGACAVTGIEIPALLRASHAKPWAKCESDQERLNAFNGFLLCAHLDAFFDKGLLTFTDDGAAIFSATLEAEALAKLNLGEGLSLRWISEKHRPFLDWHRSHLFVS